MVRISVELESPWTYLLIAGAVGLGTMVVFLGVLVTLLVLNPHKTIDEIKLLVKSFVVFEMKIWFICTVEQIDIVLDTLNLLAVTRDGEAEYLKFAYTVLFGCSSVASVCVVIAFLRLLVIRLHMRFTTYALDLSPLGVVLSRALNWCRIRQAGKIRSKTLSERLLTEEIQRNRMAQMRGVTYLLLAACEGSILCPRKLRFRSKLSRPRRAAPKCFYGSLQCFVTACILQTSQHRWPISST
jgi:hypothetical protein